MSAILNNSTKSIWNEICKEHDKRRPPFCEDDDDEPEATDEENFDASKVTPVFFGCKVNQVPVDDLAIEDFNPAVSHPALFGYQLVSKPEPPPPSPPPNKYSCSPREYLEHYIFPVLLPALEAMLDQARRERCFMRKRTKFNAGDFLTEYLYKNNPNHKDRSCVSMADIPFVKKLWQIHPRPPLPKSLLWSETEACVIIQSFLRGCKVRMEPEVQELRVWQRDWREATGNIHQSVDAFWAKNMPVDETCVVCCEEQPPVVPVEATPATEPSLGSSSSPPKKV